MLLCNQCDRGTIRLFCRYGTFACRRCHKAVFACQKYDQIGRKRLAASKLRLQLGGLPSIDEPIALKAKWKHQQTYKNARKQLDRLEAPIKAYRFRKPLSASLFAYYVA